MSIAKYFLARSLYDSIAQWGNSDSTILDNEQYVISPGEFYAQHIEVDSDCQVEIDIQVQRGQNVEVAVTDKGDFEWSLKENEQINATHRTVVGDTKQSMVVNLEKGNHTIRMAPVSSDGKSSQVKISAYITERESNFSWTADNKLDLTVWIVAVIGLAPFGFMWSLTTFFGLLDTLASQPLTAVVVLPMYLFIHFPLLLGVYLDARQTRKVSDFPKNLRIYMIVFLIPIFNIFALGNYVIKRMRTRI